MKYRQSKTCLSTEHREGVTYGFSGLAAMRFHLMSDAGAEKVSNLLYQMAHRAPASK
jgi:hypothetical protein